jgi:tetraacyldisaccharide 4'-kinase
MRPPGFWYRETSLAAALLGPLAAGYDLAGRMARAAATAHGVDAHVVCIGNLVAGGAGKTPTAIAVAALLSGRETAFLTRGYGGREPGPLAVDPDRQTADDVGDEARLLARHGPTWVSRDRAAGARAAVSNGAEIIVMDDGFQNPSLAKDLSILVIDGETGFGNGKVIPAGPLRETVAAGLARADAAVLIGDDRTGVRTRLPDGMPVFSARIEPTAETLAGEKVVAFAGIGRPQKFFDTLAAMGCEVAGRHAFADHHMFTADEIRHLRETARAAGARLVTTEKDAARLSADQLAGIETLPVRLVWDDRDGAAAFVRERLA